MYNAYIYLYDLKAANVGGGDSLAGSWETRDITDEVEDTANICTLSANQFTLDTGSYRVMISAPAFWAAGHQLRLYNISDGAMELLGSTGRQHNTTNISQTRSFVVGRFTIAAQKTFEVQHRVGDGKTTTGHGYDVPWGNNIYTIVELWRET